MTQANDCSQKIDVLKLVRDGTSQEQRVSTALDPAYTPVDEHGVADGMVFAKSYAEFLRYHDANDIDVDNWQDFFSNDVSVQLAVVTIQEVADYKTTIKQSFDFLKDSHNAGNDLELKTHLGYLFSSVASLAKQLDNLKVSIPIENTLHPTLQNLIKSQLAPLFYRLIAYYEAGKHLANKLIKNTAPHKMQILGNAVEKFSAITDIGLSKDWITDTSKDWHSYKNAIVADDSVYGDKNSSVFIQINHLATHNLFTSIFDQFLKAYSRVVSDAKTALPLTYTSQNNHQPHYALFLAYLRLFDYARTELNTLTGRHLDFYYREVLQLKEKPAEAGHAHLLIELAKQAASYQVKTGELFKAGKDNAGVEAFFANDRDFVANQAKVVALKSVYRQLIDPTKLPSSDNTKGLYASLVTNSDDGLGAELTSVDQSWQPFFNLDSTLTDINMPKADIGFAISSHYLWLAEGSRTVTLDFTVSGYEGTIGKDWSADIVCLFSGAKGWIKKSPVSFSASSVTTLTLTVSLTGDDPAIVGYNPKLHGFAFDTTSPVLLVKLRQDTNQYAFAAFENIKIITLDITVKVDNLKTLVLSNDFGAVDASKPFLAFGAQPEKGNALILGSQELFAKKLTTCDLTIEWKNKPNNLTSIAYLNAVPPKVSVAWLKEGNWGTATDKPLFDNDSQITVPIKALNDGIDLQDIPNFQLEAPYSTLAKTGYVRLALSGDLGHKEYRNYLTTYYIALTKDPNTALTPAPYTPEIAALSIKYTATQIIAFTSAQETAFTSRAIKLYHITPFGYAEQHRYLKSNIPDIDKSIYLLPQFKQTENHEAEFYIGIDNLKPPQNLSVLFQVVDGTANPLSSKPDKHIHWNYLQDNEWRNFDNNAVEDQTNALLKSGIITFAIPRTASNTNSLLPAGSYWLRAAVASNSDAVCRLLSVAAQALQVTFSNHDNDPAFSAKVLAANTISKLDEPNEAVKKITQPFAGFGGRGAETSSEFYTRVSERLRHKDRGIALWDYEHLILAAFPQLYKVKCLNHTHYEPTIYNELAAGHVSIVTIPNRQFHHLRDPLKPFTSLGLLQEVAAFIKPRLSHFVELHVENPQFEDVKVEFSVQFYSGFDESFYSKKLNDAIMRFLSPWAFSDEASISFGGKVSKSALINFVEEQAYVDYVTDFKLFHNGGNSDLSEAIASKAISILVSAKEHTINPKPINTAPAVSETCRCAT